MHVEHELFSDVQDHFGIARLISRIWLENSNCLLNCACLYNRVAPGLQYSCTQSPRGRSVPFWGLHCSLYFTLVLVSLVVVGLMFRVGVTILITDKLLRSIFEPASILVWNDYVRPSQGFTQLDRQAHLMFFAYVLQRYESPNSNPRDWLNLIEAGIFEFLYRAVLTDLKPMVFRRLVEECSAEVNELVFSQLEGVLLDFGGDFAERFKRYHSDSMVLQSSRRILGAAKCLTMRWEFGIVGHLSRGLYGLDMTKDALGTDLESFSDLLGVRQLIGNHRLGHFLDLVGQLRFQERWANAHRIPVTSVLGHMYIVALLAYVATKGARASTPRLVGNFMCGMFHDLAEIGTRDISSPVKQPVQRTLREIERNELERIVYPLLPKDWLREIRYYAEDEFSDRTLHADGSVVLTDGVTADQEPMGLSSIDGKLVRTCDRLAAYAEALFAVQHGARDPVLAKALSRIEEELRAQSLCGMELDGLFDALAANASHSEYVT